jgi:predicted ATP-grasp superfamily ATP-dependent carboligase
MTDAQSRQSHKDAFVDDLTAWIQQSQCSSVLLLGSMDAATRRDADLRECVHVFWHDAYTSR